MAAGVCSPGGGPQPWAKSCKGSSYCDPLVVESITDHASAAVITVATEAQMKD
jgi:hypothetical protein